ncbi:hypothetical protein Tco_0505537 [Tanacetum coccineum]
MKKPSCKHPNAVHPKGMRCIWPKGPNSFRSSSCKLSYARSRFSSPSQTPLIMPLEENNIKLLDVTGLDQLEQQLNSFLQQVKIREIELKMGVVKALQDQLLSASGKSLYVPFYWDKLPSNTLFSVSRKLLLSASGKSLQQFSMHFSIEWLQIMAAGMDGINNDSDAAEPQPPVMGVQITW